MFRHPRYPIKSYSHSRSAAVVTPFSPQLNDKQLSTFQDLVTQKKYYILNEFLESLLGNYQGERLSRESLLSLFTVVLPHRQGATLLQWALTRYHKNTNRMLFSFLHKLQILGILSANDMRKLFDQPDGRGRTIYQYLLSGQDTSSFLKVSALLLHQYERNELSIEHFHAILSHRDQRDLSLLISAFQSQSLYVLRLYLYQWENTIQQDKASWQRFTAILTNPYQIQYTKIGCTYRTPLLELMNLGHTEKLVIYFKKLQSCIEFGTLSQKRYFQILIDLDGSKSNPLNLLFKRSLNFIECYLEELLNCVLKGFVRAKEVEKLLQPYAAQFQVNVKLQTYFEHLKKLVEEQSIPAGLKCFITELACYANIEFTSYFAKSPLGNSRQKQSFFPEGRKISQAEEVLVKAEPHAKFSHFGYR